MKVLMFGWEFPPHISGGLGTACQGLTQALTAENTQILFVIPKADKIPLRGGFRIISASQVLLPAESASLREKAKVSGAIKMKGSTTTLAIGSTMLPYRNKTSTRFTGLTNWNYILEGRDMETSSGPIPKGKTRYSFSGGYGPDLMEEVERYATVAAEVARHHAFDIIHAHDWMTYRAGLAAKRTSGKPLVVHVHATEFDRTGQQVIPEIYEIEKRGMQGADLVIAVSQWTRNRIIASYDIPAEKVVVVHNGISRSEENVNVLVPPIGKPVVTFLGRITHQKGPRYFVEAAPKVLHRFPDVHFVMAGSGDLLPDMIDRVAELKMSDHFHFTGFLKPAEVARIWTVSKVYVMSSVSEPFGITPLEAIRARVPVIISKQSGVAEVVDHAIKVDFWDTDALADAICGILQHTGLTNTLKKLSNGALRYMTWTRAAKKINKFYHELTT